VIINETLRQTAWGTRDPLGTRVTFGGVVAEVVGVVGDVRHFGPGAPAPPEIYWPAAQIGAIPGEAIRRARRSLSLVVSTAGDPLTVVPSVRAAVQAVDADQPIASVQTMTSRLGSALWLSRASAWIVSTFGAAAFLFALLGVFGAVSYSVAQRRREIALRLALGASRSGVRHLVLRSTVVAAASGVAAGLIATQVLQRGFAWLIVDAPPLDAATLAAVVASLTALVLLACWLPARRASQVEPMRILRSE
jgi:putative ABC transport system permease protein